MALALGPSSSQCLGLNSPEDSLSEVCSLGWEPQQLWAGAAGAAQMSACGLSNVVAMV